MELKKFIGQFEEVIERVEPGTVSKDTNFRTLEGWDSLAVLTVLEMVYEEYDFQVSAPELEACESVETLFNLIEGKGNNGSG